MKVTAVKTIKTTKEEASEGQAMSDDEAIYPTHECFDDVVTFMNGLAAEGASRAELVRFTQVHAIVLAPDDTPYAHAWLEHEDGRAIQGGIYKGERIYFSANREEYRAKIRIVKEWRYTMDDCLRLDRELGTPPWAPEVVALCGGGRRVWRGEGDARWASLKVTVAGETMGPPVSAERFRDVPVSSSLTTALGGGPTKKGDLNG